MSYSRRQLEAFGETLGECVTRKEGGRIIYGGGGGGGSAPAQQTTISDLPDWAKPYAQQALAGAQALTFQKNDKGEITGLQPYKPYTDERTAQFTPLQKQAFEGVGNMQVAPQIGSATGLANLAGYQALNAGAAFNPYQARNQYRSIAGYDPTQFTNQFQAPAAFETGQFGDTYDAPDAFQAGQFQNRFQGPGAFQAGQFDVERVAGPQLEQFQMGPAERVGTGTFGTQQAQQYMSPYIEQAMEPQLREARRSSEIQRNIDQAQAVSKGAFGGSRQAIVEAERQRNLGTQLGDIRAQGMQRAFEQAREQFNAEQGIGLQGQMANQQAGLTTGQQNLAARLGVQQLGAQTGLQAALANQQQAMEAQRMAEQSRQFGAGQGLSAAQLQAQYGLSADQAQEASRQFAANQATQVAAQQAQARQAAQQAREQSRQFGAGQGLSAAQLQAQYGMSAQQAQEAANQFRYSQAAQQAAQRAQYGQAAQQLAEQSRQYGAGLGLQGLQTALTGAGQLGQLGGQQFGQQRDIYGLQNQYGTQQQQQIQNIMNQQYQDFLTQRRYPYQQLEFLSSMVRGTPTGQVQTMFAPQPTMMQNIGALGMGAYGLNQLMRAGGGTVSSYAEGGSVTDERNVEDILDKLSDTQLQQARQVAMSRRDAAQVAQIDKELAQRASLRSGLGSAFNTIPGDRQEQMMAGGGIVAFSGDEDENDDETGQRVSEPLIPVGRGDLPTYGAAMRGLTDLYSQFKSDKGFTPLTPEEETAMYDRSVNRGKEIYGDVLSKIKANIESERGMGEENLRQQRGLAALSAAEAMLQGRGLMRGLAQAGGAFGRSYGKALEADAAQKRALTNMELNLAKAEADQRMGLHEKAEARVAKANADRKAAHAAGVNKTKAEADLLYKMGRVSMPPAPTKTGTGAPKLSPDERIAAKAEAIALGKDKFMGKTGPEAADAYRESIGQSAAARMGARYNAPDRSFEHQVKLQQLYSNDPQLKAYAESLAMAQLSGNQQRIKTLQDSITAREAALAKTLPEVPTAGARANATPRSTAVSVPQAAIDYLKANPSARADFDAKYGAGAAKRILGE